MLHNHTCYMSGCDNEVGVTLLDRARLFEIIRLFFC